MGKNSAEGVLFNARMVGVFAFAMNRGNQIAIQAVVESTNMLSIEKNHVVNKWRQLGIKQYGRGDSQALMHLYKQYCSQYEQQVRQAVRSTPLPTSRHHYSATNGYPIA